MSNIVESVRRAAVGQVTDAERAARGLRRDVTEVAARFLQHVKIARYITIDSNSRVIRE